jgi:hypothetical protein
MRGRIPACQRLFFQQAAAVLCNHWRAAFHTAAAAAVAVGRFRSATSESPSFRSVLQLSMFCLMERRPRNPSNGHS